MVLSRQTIVLIEMDLDAFPEDSSEINTNDDRALATESYQSIWEDFYNWESLYCRRAIEELASSGDLRSPPLETKPVSNALDLSEARSLSLDEECTSSLLGDPFRWLYMMSSCTVPTI
jgi:hypothetical protein